MAKAEDLQSTKAKLAALERLRDEALHSGDERAVNRQRERGKLLARERLEKLLDPRQLRRARPLRATPQPPLRDDGQAALGRRRHDRLRPIAAAGLRLFPGLHGHRRLVGHAPAQKICKIMDLAIKPGVPVIGMYDSGGARIQEGVATLGGYADLLPQRPGLRRPQISAILGPAPAALSIRPR